MATVKEFALRLECAFRKPDQLAMAGAAVFVFVLDADRMIAIQRWSRKFGPVVKVDRIMKEVIQNEETKESFA